MLNLLAQAGEIFPEQVTTNMLTQNLVYASGTVGALMVVVGLVMLDAASVRRLNVFNSTIEKLVGFFIGFATYFGIGFALWNWQYNDAFEVANPLGQSIEDWWLGGTLANDLAQNVSPDVFPGLNNFQIFIFFLAVFAGIVNILLHFAVSERMKASAYFITCFVATIVSSLLSYLTWGSVGPLTNEGFHDFFGVGFVYLFPAGMALVFVRMLGKRPGMFEAHSKVAEYRTGNLWTLSTGALLIFAGLPMVILSCLFFFDPEALAVINGVYLSASPTLVRRTLEAEPDPATRMVVGYAGWGAGQLDVELAEGSWLLAPVESDLIFKTSADTMWEAAIRRLGAEPSMLQGSSGVH